MSDTVEKLKQIGDNIDTILEDVYSQIGGGGTDTDLSEYVKKTDYASETKAGVVKTNYRLGINISNGTLTLSKASNADIDAKASSFGPIVPSNLDYAVKKALTDSKIEWTDEEKQAVRTLLGIG